jgi:hypothetical protein
MWVLEDLVALQERMFLLGLQGSKCRWQEIDCALAGLGFGIRYLVGVLSKASFDIDPNDFFQVHGAACSPLSSVSVKCS